MQVFRCGIDEVLMMSRIWTTDVLPAHKAYMQQQSRAGPSKQRDATGQVRACNCAGGPDHCIMHAHFCMHATGSGRLPSPPPALACCLPAGGSIAARCVTPSLLCPAARARGARAGGDGARPRYARHVRPGEGPPAAGAAALRVLAGVPHGAEVGGWQGVLAAAAHQAARESALQSSSMQQQAQ